MSKKKLKPHDYAELCKLIDNFLTSNCIEFDTEEEDGRCRFTLTNVVEEDAYDEETGENKTDCGYDLAIEVLAVER